MSGFLSVILMVAAPALGQEVKPEDEWRAEIARLKAHLARAEALLERLEPRTCRRQVKPDRTRPAHGSEQDDIQGQGSGTHVAVPEG